MSAPIRTPYDNLHAHFVAFSWQQLQRLLISLKNFSVGSASLVRFSQRARAKAQTTPTSRFLRLPTAALSQAT